MTTAFNWRVVSPSTLRAHERAVKDFEIVTGIRVDRADAASMLVWEKSMESRGLSINTVRTRLSAVSVVSGVKIILPKRKQVPASEQIIMTEDQICTFLRVVRKDSDRALLIGILLTGKRPAPFEAHFAGLGVANKLTTQEITRKIKRYASLGGLDRNDVNLRTLIRSGKALLKKYDAQTLVDRIIPQPAQATVKWKPLHGIGRRTHTVKA